MKNLYKELTNSQAWQVSVGAATKALTETGYHLVKLPGRGRSNVYAATKDGKMIRISIRTTKGRKFAFPSTDKGKAWLTLDDVEVVVVAAVDDRDDPTIIQVYKFDAAEVRKRFSDAYSARTKADIVVRDNFGMWISLDKDNRGIPRSVGTGLGDDFPPIAEYLISDLVKEKQIEIERGSPSANTDARTVVPKTIAEVVDLAKQRIAALAGVETASVKLELRIEY